MYELFLASQWSTTIDKLAWDFTYDCEDEELRSRLDSRVCSRRGRIPNSCQRRARWTYLTSPRILRPVRTFSGGELLALVLPRVTNWVRVTSFRLFGGVIRELYRRIRRVELLKQPEKENPPRRSRPPAFLYASPTCKILEVSMARYEWFELEEGSALRGGDSWGFGTDWWEVSYSESRSQ
jgi:hypothetical protein